MEFELFKKEVEKYIYKYYPEVTSCEFYNVANRVEIVDGVGITYCECSDVCFTTQNRIYTIRVTADSLRKYMVEE